MQNVEAAGYTVADTAAAVDVENVVVDTAVQGSADSASVMVEKERNSVLSLAVNGSGSAEGKRLDSARLNSTTWLDYEGSVLLMPEPVAAAYRPASEVVANAAVAAAADNFRKVIQRQMNHPPVVLGVDGSSSVQ